ncbi:Right handed beta helix region [Spirosomataceae bacterium TFI 002]|nr:Right handed beta helix region [Spirosomataceae bacterium TFI 002]
MYVNHAATGAVKGAKELKLVANSLEVTNTDDAGSGSLRDVIANAVSNDTIRFSPTINGDTIKLTSGQILIDKNLVIIGNGIENSIIDGSAKSRIFEIAAFDTLKVNYLTIQNGKTTSTPGGGILVLGSLHLNYSKIDKCSSYAGGAIRSSNFDSEIIIRYSTISNNRSSWGGGGLFLKNDQTEISNSSFFNNNSTFHGGAIKATRYITELNVTNTTISGNSSSEGGGIFICSSNVNITNSTITNNSATMGGGIMLEKDDTNPELSLKNTILYNSASSSSPDIFTNSQDYVIDEGNNLVFASGAHGITSGNNLNPLLGTLQDNGGPTLTHALLSCSPAYNAGTGTSADQRGEAVYGGVKDIGAYEDQNPLPNPLIVTNTNDDGCGSLRYAVANAVSNDTIRFSPTINGDSIKLVTQIILDKNLVILGNDTTNTIIDGMANSRIFKINEFKKVTIDGIKMQNGRASGSFPDGDGGAIFNEGTASFANCIFSGNKADNDGGGISNLYRTASFINCTISGNTADDEGGGVKNDGLSLPSFVNCTITGNNARHGGGLFELGSFRSTMINCTIAGNSASSNGGGIAFELVSSYFRLTNSIITNNSSPDGPNIKGVYSGSNNIIGGDPLFVMNVPTAPSTGGDLRLQACSPAINAGTADITGLNLGLVDLAGNPRVEGGKIDIGAYEYQASSVSKPLIVTNTNDNGCGSLRFLVAFSASGDTIRFSPTINRDTIKLTSGQILIDKNLVILGNDTTNTIIDGMANSRIFKINANKKVTIDGIKMQNGRASGSSQDGDGGAIFNMGTLQIMNSLLFNNNAIRNGGALFNDFSFSANITIHFANCTISENSAIRGGGVYNSSTASFTNCTISGNSADNEGGGVYGAGTLTSCSNCIISGNYAKDGGGFYEESILKNNFINCSISGNSASSSGGGIASLSIRSKFSFTNSIVAKNAAPNGPDISGSYTDVSNNIIGGDPLFLIDVPTAPSTQGDLSLQACSPGINAGTADTTGLNLGLVDLAGNPRVYEDRIDIGAYEYQSPLPNPLLVTNTNDDGCGSLRYEVANAVSNDTIRFSSTINGDTIKLTSGQILIDKNLVIIGNGKVNTIIDGQMGSRIFNVSSSTDVKIQELTIQAGNVNPGSGGGIYNDGTLKLESVNIVNCQSRGGGGIYNSGQLEVIKCVVSGNRILNTTYAFGGGINHQGGSLLIKQSQISGNVLYHSSPSESFGGGLYLNNSNVIIESSTISGNRAQDEGGGISGQTFTMRNSIVAGNYAQSNPDIDRLNPTCLHSLVGNNQGNGITSGVNGNLAGTASVPLDAQFTSVVITSATEGSSSGDLSLLPCSPAINAGTADTTGLNLGLVDLAGNPRVFEGRIDIGAYEYQSPLPNPLLVTNTNDDGCGSLRYEVANAVSNDTIRFSPTIDGESIKLITQIILDKNLVILGNDTTNTILDGMANSRIFKINANKKVTIDGIKMQNGRAIGFLPNSFGGAVFNEGTANFSNCKFSGNKADEYGGAVFNFDMASFVNCKFSGNKADEFYGGAVYNFDMASFVNCIISGNTAVSGGGITNSSGEMSLTNCKISGNYARDEGGGIFSLSSLISFVNVTISGNSASSKGGGIATNIEGGSPEFSFTNSILAMNTAPDEPNISGSYTDVSNNIIGGDPLFVMDVPTAPSTGGDLRLQACSPAINAGTPDTTGLNLGLVDLAGNPRVYEDRIDIGAFEYQRNSYKSTIFVDADATGNDDGSTWANAFTDLQDALDARMACSIVDTILIAEGTYYPTESPVENIADARDRAFHLANANVVIIGGYSASAGTPTGGATILSGDLVTAGTAIDSAYHVFITTGLSSATVISKVTIAAGKANVNSSITYASKYFYRNLGGGMINASSSPTLTNCVFTGNSANNGGGMYNSSSSPTLTNCVFTGNSANSGGGMRNFSSSPKLTNCAFTGNSATNGGGMRNTVSSPTLTNTLFYKNTATSGKSISNFSSSLNSSSTHNASDAELSDFPNTIIDLSGKYYKDLFADSTDLNGTDDVWGTADDGLFLLPNSILRDAGTAAGAPALDLAGNTRPTPPSIGAYEYSPCVFAASVVYVDIAATGNETGSSWANAYTDLQDAIDNQCGGLDIWVAAGTYHPTVDHTGNSSPADDKEKVFFLTKNIKIYGGFAGTESSLSERNWEINKTILSGDFNNDDTPPLSTSPLTIGNTAENAYHVIVNVNLTADAVFDGLTVKGGNATGSSGFLYQLVAISQENGGGMQNVNSSPTLRNITFEQNNAENGGGIYNGIGSAPEMNNLTFRDNVAVYGAGIYDNDNNPTIKKSTFENNKVFQDGGGIYGFSLEIIHSIFLKNSALRNGGGIYFTNADAKISNSTFVENTASTNGGGLYSISSTPMVTNTIFWNNTKNGDNNIAGADILATNNNVTATNCLTQVYNIGTDNIINKDPLFVDAANGDLSLQSCSPAINTGTADTTGLNLGLVDFDGNPRVFEDKIDIGAFEHQRNSYKSTIFVDADATGNNDGSTWVNAYTDLQDALDARMACSIVDTILIAEGTYYPTQSPDGRTTNTRDRAFHLANANVVIQGGYNASTGTPTGGATTLSGDLVTAGTASNSAYHVFITTGLSSATVISTLTITAGKANGNSPITYESKNFSRNYGGGMYNLSSSPTLTNCMFAGNSAGIGGGIYNSSSSPTLFNCVFVDNSANLNGGGMNNSSSSPTLTNCMFAGNSANYFGGGMENRESSPTITNCAFTGNSANNGGGVYNYSLSSPTLTNTLFFKNTAPVGKSIGTLSTSLNSNSTHNASDADLSVFPNTLIDLSGKYYKDLFVDSTDLDGTDDIWGSADDGLFLLPNSILRDAGTATGAPALDLAGNTRPTPPSIGAYEYSPCVFAASLVYVDIAATGNETGTTWANAYTDLQDALDARMACSIVDTILIAEGTYYPSQSPDGSIADVRDRAFHLANANVVIIGGYSASTGSQTGGSTILSGDLVTAGTGSDSAYHVFITTGLSSATVISKLTITAGKANGDFNFMTYASKGFSRNRGGGMSNCSSSPFLTNCVFEGNSAHLSGGGIYNFSSSLATLTNCQFTSNSAANGGGMDNTSSSSATLTNCLFAGNSADNNGGGMRNSSSSPATLTNCVFASNSANVGGGMYNSSSSTSVTNSIFWNNMKATSTTADGADIENNSSSSPIVTYTSLQSYTGSTGCLIGDPLFVDATNGNYRLQACSPAINAGTPDTTGLNLGLVDLAGNQRVFDGRIDIGAYERQTEPFKVTTSAVSAVICPGNTLNLSALAENGDEPATYTWTGPNGFTDNIKNPVVSNADSGMYMVTAVAGLCTAKDSIKITYPAEISITTSPSAFNDIYVCENALTVIGLDIENAAEYTFQWQQSTGGAFTNLSESSLYSQVTNDSLSINPSSVSMDGYQYRAMISNGCKTIISDTITLKVGATPMITLQPVSQIVCPTNEAILEVDVNGAGVSFQWQIDHGSGFVNVSGSEYYGQNSKKLIVSNFDYAKSGKAFRCLVFTACFQITSDPATITIYTDVTILSQPMSQTVCEFGTAIFTAQAVKLSAGTLTYQWQRKSGIGVWTNINTGGRYTVNGNQLSIANVPAAWNGAEFRCLMNDYCQTIPKTLNVIPVAHVTQNPVNQEICVGNNANFSVTAAGEGLTYRWQVNSGSAFVNLTDGGIYQGATSANLSLSFPSATVNNYQYRCVVSGTSTCDLVADTSAVASISVGVSAEAQTVFYNSPINTDDGVTQAVGYILGINDILAPNGKAEFRAGNSIQLMPGFEAQAGAVFTAKIMNPCQNTSTSFDGGGSKIPKEKVK